MTWKTIRLELARTADFPHGSSEHGYLLRLPLDGSGLVDRALMTDPSETPAVHRFAPGVPVRTGVVIHRPGGWAISYEPGDADDEPVFHLENHPIVQGEYLTITENDGDALPYRVVHVTD